MAPSELFISLDWRCDILRHSTQTTLRPLSASFEQHEWLRGCDPPASPPSFWNLSTSMWALEETGTSEASRHLEGMKLFRMQVQSEVQRKLTPLMLLDAPPTGPGPWSTGHPSLGWCFIPPATLNIYFLLYLQDSFKPVTSWWVWDSSLSCWFYGPPLTSVGCESRRRRSRTWPACWRRGREAQLSTWQITSPQSLRDISATPAWIQSWGRALWLHVRSALWLWEICWLVASVVIFSPLTEITYIYRPINRSYMALYPQPCALKSVIW